MLRYKTLAFGNAPPESYTDLSYFGRMIEKTDGDAVTQYRYNRWNQRTRRITKVGGVSMDELKRYDKFGRLKEIQSNGKTVKYQYNDKNQLAVQMIDGVPVEFTYTRYGQLESKILGGSPAPISSLKYLYSPDGMIAGRVVDGKFQMYSYDKRGQLLRVADMTGKVAEAYQYDPAGNILSKTINGKTTTYTYDKANQLATSTVNGMVTNYAYDAAGRMVKEGDKAYSYGYLDKILSVQENGKQTAAFDYHVDGQIASATYADKSESFLWDGLAMISRNETSYINEPYVTGGNPLLSSNGEVMFNDMLGITLGVKGNDYNPIAITAFGEVRTTDGRITANAENTFFTGKPAIGELGYAFLFRNYRPDQGKWQTSDPLGYPDGWNNFAYVNNETVYASDFLGAAKVIGINDAAKMKITTSDGCEIILNNPSAQALVNTLTEIKNSGQTIVNLHNIGHANNEMMYINNNNEVIAINSNGIKINNLDTQNSTDITQLLKDTTNSNSEIYLDGCHTAESSKWISPTETDIANEMSKLLDAVVSGNTGYAMYPYFGWNTLSDKQSYKKGVRE